LSAQIKQNFKEVAANSDYLLKVLTISNAMLMEGCGKVNSSPPQYTIN